MPQDKNDGQKSPRVRPGKSGGLAFLARAGPALHGAKRVAVRSKGEAGSRAGGEPSGCVPPLLQMKAEEVDGVA